MPHPRKQLLRTVTDPISILTMHLQDQPYFLPSLLIHLETFERATNTSANHRDSTNELLISTASSASPVFYHPILQIQLLQVQQPIPTILSAHYLHQVLLSVDYPLHYHQTYHLRHCQEYIHKFLHTTHHLP